LCIYIVTILAFCFDLQAACVFVSPTGLALYLHVKLHESTYKKTKKDDDGFSVTDWMPFCHHNKSVKAVEEVTCSSNGKEDETKTTQKSMTYDDSYHSLSINDAVWIEHWHNLEDIHLPQCTCQWLVTHQEIQSPCSPTQHTLQHTTSFDKLFSLTKLQLIVQILPEISI